jgi:ABC-2 type transport system ATP-binding protein
MDTIITTENLSKHYSDVIAVSKLSLNVRKGEIYGFLGLNGAGKTTTIRLLLGMIKPTTGFAKIYGERVSASKTNLWGKIGYLVETPNSYPNLTVRENLEIIRRLRFIKDTSSVDNVIEKLQLGTYENRLTKNLSLGNAQRLGLAKALIHHPEILILDEPANGMDPVGIFEIREMLVDLAANQGVTILISSHILGEISRFATRIGIIHEGKLLQEVNTDQLDKLCNRRLLVSSNNVESTKSLLLENNFVVSAINNDIIELKDEAAINKPDIIATLMVNAGCAPTLLQVVEEDLESYFLRTIETKGGLR